MTDLSSVLKESKDGDGNCVELLMNLSSVLKESKDGDGKSR